VLARESDLREAVANEKRLWQELQALFERRWKKLEKVQKNMTSIKTSLERELHAAQVQCKNLEQRRGGVFKETVDRENDKNGINGN
jgi:Skp family chaperone for outer membrane proteins